MAAVGAANRARLDPCTVSIGVFPPWGGKGFLVAETVPSGGKSVIPGGIVFAATPGGVYPRWYGKKIAPWPIHTDSSGERVMDKVNEQPSAQHGEEGDSDKSDQRNETGSLGSLAPGAKK